MADAPELRPTLEDVIVAFQKSLARARNNAQIVSRRDRAVAQGEQPLFVVDAVDVNLRVGLEMVAPEADEPDRILVDFSAPGEARSTIGFRVVIRPLAAEVDNG
jgi:hypothetical protein